MTREEYIKISKKLSPEMKELLVIAENSKQVEKILGKKELEAVNKVKAQIEPPKEIKKIKLLEQETNKPVHYDVELLKAGVGTNDLSYLYNLNMERDVAVVMSDVTAYAKEHNLSQPEFRKIGADILNNYRRNYFRKEIREIAEEQDFVRMNPEMYKSQEELMYDEEKYTENEQEEENDDFSFFHNPFDLWQQS